METGEEKIGLSHKVDAIYQAIQPKDKKKGKEKGKEFKLPMNIRMNKKKVKKNYVVVFYLRTNGFMDIRFIQIENDMIKIDNYHDASSEHIFQVKIGKKIWPAMIVPEFDMLPISISKRAIDAVEKGRTPWAQKVNIKAQELSQLKGKKGIDMKTILIVLGVGAAAIFILTQFFGKK